MEETNSEETNYTAGDASFGQQPSNTATTGYTTTEKTLDRRNSMLAGVAGGLSEYLNADPTLVRLLIVAGTFTLGPVVPILYAAAWMIVPNGQVNVVNPTPPPPSAPVYEPASSMVPAPPAGAPSPTPDYLVKS